ncbi:MAG: hypothetical protein KGI52_06585 [Burkholderiales bacterium]|nr:hypothetical protein [Burkholderiales bacterium]
MSQVIGARLYPNGTAQPSIVTAACRVYPGWPVQANLDADLAAGVVNVSIYPLPAEQVESIVNANAQVSVQPLAGTQLAVAGATVTVSGVPAVGDVAMVYRNYAMQAYAIKIGDTPAIIAQQLAALIGGTAVGAVVTAPTGTFALTARVTTNSTTLSARRRIARHIQITTWAPTPALRDAVAQQVDAGLYAAERLALPDGTTAGVAYMGSPMTDMFETARIYRRDVMVMARFVSTDAANAQGVGEITAAIASPATSAVSFQINGV